MQATGRRRAILLAAAFAVCLPALAQEAVPDGSAGVPASTVLFGSEIDPNETVRGVPGFAGTTYDVTGESVRGRILVPVRFGKLGPFPFLLDLSIRHPVVDAKLAASAGLPRAEIGEGRVEAPVFLARVLRCGTLPPREALLAGVDLSALSARLGRPIAGLWPAQQPGLEVEIDVAAAKVRWRGFSESALAEDDEAAPMTLAEDGAPRVSVRVLGKAPRTLALDLSRGDRIALSDATLAELGVLRGDTPRLRILGGATASIQCRLPLLTVGGVDFSDLICTVVPDDGEERLGLGVLRHFRITLNYEFGIVKFEALDGVALRDPPLAGYGLLLEARRNGFWTVRVAEGTPAHRAGMRAGDRLIALGGVRVAGVGHEVVSRLLSAESETLLRVIFRRGSEPARSVTLKAEVLL